MIGEHIGLTVHNCLIYKRLKESFDEIKRLRGIIPKPYITWQITLIGYQMEKTVFNKFRTIIYEKSVITLSENKEALVSARIAKRIRKLGLDSHRDYLQFVLGDKSGEEIVSLLDVISTNVTHFFRESHHFDILQEAMGTWMAKGQNRFRFWSAGCSSGEEPYTIAMTLQETANGRNPDMRILATDISTQILAKSIKGTYEKKKMENVTPKLRERYFEKNGREKDASYSVKHRLKSMIVFKRLNLSIVPFPMSGPMDVIFCRNVMIYFDNQVREKLLGEFYRLLKPGGYLMVGHAESLTGMLSGFKTVQPSVYIKD